jgi:hypothetical protein
MSDDENQEESNNIRSIIVIRRRRPQHQTSEEKAAWDEEIRVLRNAKAKIARLKKKFIRAANPPIFPLSNDFS